MSVYNWKFDFSPAFPIHLLEYEVIGQRDPMHWHQYYEIGLCLEGTGNYRYAEKLYPSATGDIFVTNNYETHVASANGKQRFIFLIFLPEFFSSSNETSQILTRQYLNALRYNPFSFINRIPSSDSCASRLAALIRQSYEVYKKGALGWQMHIDISIRTILLELFTYYSKTIPEPDTIAKFSPKMQAAQVFIGQHYNETLTLETVADAVNLNVSYFRHVFKNTFQLSFKEYLMQIRLNRACTLFAETNDNINDIIEKVGCNNYSYFYRIFKMHYNMTPAEYRHMNKLHQE